MHSPMRTGRAARSAARGHSPSPGLPDVAHAGTATGSEPRSGRGVDGRDGALPDEHLKTFQTVSQLDFGHLQTERVGYARHLSAQREAIGVRTLPTTMIRLLAPFAPLFSERVWEHVQLLLAGAILAPGKRTVASALRAVGLQEERQFCRYHRVLSRASWSSREAGCVLLGLLVAALAGSRKSDSQVPPARYM